MCILNSIWNYGFLKVNFKTDEDHDLLKEILAFQPLEVSVLGLFTTKDLSFTKSQDVEMDFFFVNYFKSISKKEAANIFSP